jgi:hypothetical protein
MDSEPLEPLLASLNRWVTPEELPELAVQVKPAGQVALEGFAALEQPS